MPEKSANPADMVQAMIVLVESLGAVIDAAAGYKAKCVEAGFPDDIAAGMAAELHRHLLRKCFGS